MKILAPVQRRSLLARFRSGSRESCRSERAQVRFPTFMLLAMVPLAVTAAGCQSMNHADRGAALGALTGALAGGAIGKNNGDTTAGAVIGGAVGALAGSAIGGGVDAEIARNQALIEQQVGRTMQGAVSVQDVMTLSQAGLSDEVIVTHIRANGVAQRPSPQDLIDLSQSGVSQSVIQALQTTPPPATPVSPSVVESPRTVVVEQVRYLPPPPPPMWFHGHYHHGRRPKGSSVHWGFSVRN
jgi:hypothetical protein